MTRLPGRTKCLKTLRRIYPGAHFAGRTENGVRTLELRYQPPSGGGAAPVAEVSIPLGGRESALPWALLVAACKRYGYTATWNGSAIGFTPVEGYKGPEQMIPVELDPSEDPTPHRWVFDGGTGGHRGEYDFTCSACGASDWVSLASHRNGEKPDPGVCPGKPVDTKPH